MLFQGQEFAAGAPFIYFAHLDPELAGLVAKGRRSFLEQFRGVAAPDAVGALPDPGKRESFLCCKLDFQDRVRHRPMYLMHEHLLRLRREQTAIREPARIEGAVLSSDAFVVRFFARDGSDALLIVNLGSELQFTPSPEPLLAPIEGHGWQLLWSSESPEYGGSGTPQPETTGGWLVPGRAAVLLSPDARRELPRAKLSEKD
jgi:maltooligosyltrehalose trehalohydrolase